MHHYSLYTATCVLLWAALCTLGALTREDNRLSRSDKRTQYMTYSIIALALLAEWSGVFFSMIAAVPAWAIRLVKCFDYILTPMAGWALTARMGIDNRLSKGIAYVLRTNVVLQIVSLFTGWMVTVNGAGTGYSHGPLYPAYVLSYVAVLALVVLQFRAYGQSFRRENRLSLYTSVGVVVIGILMQEVLGNEIRTAYIGLTFGAMLLYIHSAEFTQQAVDARLRKQQKQITTDSLTGTRSRHAYARMLDAFSRHDTLPENLAVFSIDANGLKEVNDEHGHDAGDELLRGAAECIMEVFDRHGSCYRIGGDEFVVISHMNRKQADKSLERLQERTNRWHGPHVDSLSLSAGYALSSEHRGLTCEELIGLADEAMYAAKAEYYRQEGHDRRHPRDAAPDGTACGGRDITLAHNDSVQG